MSLHPQLISLYETQYTGLDETHYDLCKALLPGLKKGKREITVSNLVKPLEEVMGGSIYVGSINRFRFRTSFADFQMLLLAEGIQKVAMLPYLIFNGSLGKYSTIYWDEPETNLNPKLMALIAKALSSLSNSGIQIIIATHSLFLMKELALQVTQQARNKNSKFFSFRPTDDGVQIDSGKALMSFN